MAIEKGIETKKEDMIAKNYISVKIKCLRFLDSHKILEATLINLSTSIKSFLPLVAYGDELFRNKLAYPYEKGQTI